MNTNFNNFNVKEKMVKGFCDFLNENVHIVNKEIKLTERDCIELRNTAVLIEDDDEFLVTLEQSFCNEYNIEPTSLDLEYINHYLLFKNFILETYITKINIDNNYYQYSNTI
tara:strand:- start:324 stop:659 length:336 start_codon:yes stop_codon:yes gene_type:complete